MFNYEKVLVRGCRMHKKGAQIGQEHCESMRGTTAGASLALSLSLSLCACACACVCVGSGQPVQPLVADPPVRREAGGVSAVVKSRGHCGDRLKKGPVAW